MMSRQILGLDRLNGIRADFPIGLRGSVHLNEKTVPEIQKMARMTLPEEASA
jgi:hypothetical protein